MRTIMHEVLYLLVPNGTPDPWPPPLAVEA